MKSAKLFTYRIFLLIAVTCLLAHEVVPHHHHSPEVEESKCCSHSENSQEIPCSVFDNVPFDSVKQKPFSIRKESIALSFSSFLVPAHISVIKSLHPNFLGFFDFHYVLKKPLVFISSFSLRGPPII